MNPGLHVSQPELDDDAYLGQYIPLHYHGQMLADARRMAAFEEAIRKLVPEGAHVVELGGGTGVLSYFAARSARRVTCVERVPHVAEAARRLLALNGVAEKVTVVEADARDFEPDEPADVVICEMLHAALLRERQVEVLGAFRARHAARFGRAVGLVLPEATILAVQLVSQTFEFHGYHAPVPLFDAGLPERAPVELAEPHVYAVVEYARDPLTARYALDAVIPSTRAGTLNALRFITRNVIGMFPEEGRSADWLMHHLVLPLATPLALEAGERVAVRFQYSAGAAIGSLAASIQVARA